MIEIKKNYFFYLTLLLSILKLCYSPLTTADLYIWASQGMAILDQGTLLVRDLYSVHSFGVEYYPSYVSSVLYALLFKLGGSTALFIFFRVYLMLFLVFLLRKNISSDSLMGTKGALLIALAMSGLFFQLDRSSVLVIPFAYILIQRIDNLKALTLPLKELFLFYLLTAVWTNLHPSALILLVVVGYKIIIEHYYNGTKAIKLFSLFIPIVCGLVSTPIGLSFFRYAYDTVLVSQERLIPEWSNLFAFYYPAHLFLYLVICIFLYVELRKVDGLRKIFRSIYPIFIVLGILSARNIIWVFLFVPFFINQFKLFTCKQQKESRFYVLTLLFLFVFNIFNLVDNFMNNQAVDNNAPRELVSLVKTWKGKKIFNSANLGGTITLYGGSNNKIFIDNRNTVFSSSVYQDYLDIMKGNNSSALLTKYAIDTIVLSTELSAWATSEQFIGQGWEITQENETFVALSRAR